MAATLNTAQAKTREELLAKGLFNNGQEPSSLKKTKKTLSSQTSTNTPQTDILSKAPKIPPVANLSVPQGSTSSLAQIKNAPPPVTTTPPSQKASNPVVPASKGNKHTGIFTIGPSS
jgi:hypothetical protein